MLTEPQHEFERLDTLSQDSEKFMLSGHYEIARAILVLAIQVMRVADAIKRVTHSGSILITKRGG